VEITTFELGLLALCFLVLIAFFAGLIDSVVGGGGLLAVPTLLLVGLPPHMALGTNKFMATAGTTAAFITYARNGAVVWRVAAIGAIFSFLGSSPALIRKILLFSLALLFATLVWRYYG